MRLFFSIFILLLPFSFSIAQDGEIITYIRKDGELCPKSKAAYVRKVVMEGDVYHVKEYDLKGNLFMDAKCSSVIPMIFEGLCTYFYENGQKRMETFFKRNRPAEGGWGYWTENGESLSSKYPSNSITKDSTLFRTELFDEKFKSASYPGGDKALVEFVGTIIQYPREIAWRNISDKMLVFFTIDTTGRVEAFTYNQRMGHDFEDQIARLFRSMPLWTPATYDGKKVKTRQLLPVNFIIPRG